MKKTIAAVQCYGFHYLTSQYMFFLNQYLYIYEIPIRSPASN